jgi:ketosteroid isomerase-like protein
MSRENVELARQYIEAFNASGLDGVEQFWHPDIEVFDPPNFPDADRYVGEAAVRERVEGYIELGWDAHFWDPEYLDAGEEVVVIFRMRGRTAHGGGLPLESAFAHVLVFEAGKVCRIRQYLSKTEALEATGLSE